MELFIRISKKTDYDLYCWALQARRNNVCLATLMRSVIVNAVCGNPIEIPACMNECVPLDWTTIEDVDEEGNMTKRLYNKTYGYYDKLKPIINVSIEINDSNPVLDIFEDCFDRKKTEVFKNIIRYAVGKILGNYYLKPESRMISHNDINYKLENKTVIKEEKKEIVEDNGFMMDNNNEEKPEKKPEIRVSEPVKKKVKNEIPPKEDSVAKVPVMNEPEPQLFIGDEQNDNHTENKNNPMGDLLAGFSAFDM